MVGGTALAAGAILGVRHALEADHLAAIATIVEEGTDRPSFVGASWGVGHSLPIVVLGLAFVGLGIRLPEAVTQLFEAVVGVVLIYLGARMLWSIAVGVRAHDHGFGPHSHLELGGLSLGITHHHFDEESFLVGVVHGFAGSGALVIALVSTAPSMGSALTFLSTFTLLSIATMAVISAVWGRTLETAFTTYLEGIAGVLGVVIGFAFVLGQAGGVAAF